MLIPALAFALLAATPAPAPTRLAVDAVVEHVQKRYDAANDFRARFTQTLTSTAMGRKTNSAGGVMFKKPGRMRWDYDKPEKATYVSDGGVLWLYEPEDQQAFKQELKSSQLPAALAFLTGKGKLAAEFDITTVAKSPYGTPGDYLLSLSPKVAEPQVKSILFVVDREASAAHQRQVGQQRVDVSDRAPGPLPQARLGAQLTDLALGHRGQDRLARR